MQKSRESEDEGHFFTPLGGEDPLGKKMAGLPPSILAWRIPWTEAHGHLIELDMTE